MHARLTQFEVAPDGVDKTVRYFAETAVPQVKPLGGYQGVALLVDRAAGKVAAVSFWESEEALAAAEETMNRMRAGFAQAFAPTAPPTTQVYEVALSELPAG